MYLSSNLKIVTIICLIILPVALCNNQTQCNSQSKSVFSILNILFQLNALPVSQQIPVCFSKSYASNLNNYLANLTLTGAEAGTTYITRIPAYFTKYLSANLNTSTIKCLALSRDLLLLVGKYNTPYSRMAEVYMDYAAKNYMKTHYYFANLMTLLEAGNYQAFGYTFNNFSKYVFGSAPVVYEEWSKVAENVYNIATYDYFGVTVSNGIIGAVSSNHPLKLKQTVLAGAYDKFGRGRVDNIVYTFPALNVYIYLYSMSVTKGGFYNFRQYLNLKSGEMIGEFSSQYCSVSYKYFALKNLPFAFYTIVEINAHYTSELVIKNWHYSPDYLGNIIKSFEHIDTGQFFTIMHTKGTTPSGKLDLSVASSFILPDYYRNTLQIHYDWNTNGHLTKLKIQAVKGNTYRFGIVTALISSEHHEDPANYVIRIVIKAVSTGETSLIAEHRSRWLTMWENDIVIYGNVEDQKDVRMMLYHCYAFINYWKSYGISPMGLSGLGYNGHVFWDMDLWIYPGILALKPNLAKTLIEYRYERLSAARNNAFINGYLGAMFPWESSKSGVYYCPVWAMPGPLEHHISGCVAMAAWNYYCVAQDIDWLRYKGFDIISSVAYFWASRVYKDTDGNYHIRHVVAADYWAYNVDDDAFTNGVAIRSLQITNQAARLLNIKYNPLYDQIANKLILLSLPENVTQEHATYKGENIKQADVNLLAYPLKIIKDIYQITRDLAYYQTKIPNYGTPAMTYAIFTLLYSRLGDSNQAYYYFKYSYKENLRKPFGVFAENKGGTNPYFLTGAGGVIQSMVFGFGGYDITDKGLVHIKTAIPKYWTSVTIKGFKTVEYDS